MSKINLPLEATITLFDVNACGFYKRYKSEHRFGSLLQSLEDLQRWGNGKSLAQTKLVDISEDDDTDPVYLFSAIQGTTGDWLVTTWNETASSDGVVATVKANAIVGSASMDSTNVGVGNLPGYPGYFYVMPNEGYVAAIRLESRKVGRKGFQEFMRNFLRLHARHTVYSPPNADGERDLLGYAEMRGDEPERLNPKFDLAEVRNPGKLAEIKQRCHDIRHVVRKISLNIQQQVDRDFWQTLLAKAGMAASNTTLQTFNVKYDMQTVVSPAELDNMINDWEANRHKKWDDYGVLFRGGSATPLWFSSSIARDKFHFTVQGTTSGDIDMNSFLQALSQKRADIVRLKQ